MICKSIFLIHLNLKTLFMSISISNHHQMTYKSAYGNMDRQRVNFWYLFNKLTLRHWCCLLFLCSTTVHHCILHVPIILHYQMSLDLPVFGYLQTFKHWSTSVYYNKHAHKLSFHIMLKIPREVITTSLLPSNNKISY